jgi:hypothetical protein
MHHSLNIHRVLAIEIIEQVELGQMPTTELIGQDPHTPMCLVGVSTSQQISTILLLLVKMCLRILLSMPTTNTPSTETDITEATIIQWEERTFKLEGSPSIIPALMSTGLLKTRIPPILEVREILSLMEASQKKGEI